MVRRSRTVWLLGFVLLLVSVPAEAKGQALELTIVPSDQGWPAIVAVGPVLEDAALRQALDSALPVRFHLRVELWRKGLFDRLEAVDEASLALLRDPISGGYTVEAPGVQRRVRSIAEAQAAVETMLSSELRASRGGRYYYLGTLEVETLSLTDLEELRRWLRGDVASALGGQSPPTRAVERGLRRLMTRVIGLPARRFEARSPNFETG